MIRRTSSYMLVLAISFLAMDKVLAFEAEDIDLSGFMTWGVAKSNNPSPWYVNREITDDVCYSCDTTIGLQLDYEVVDELRVSSQLVKRPEDAWDKPILEWAYVAYELSGNLEFRAGKLRLPMFLMSDYYYVGNAYPWIRPVAEVYNRQLGMTAFDGIDFIYDWHLNDQMTLSIHPYFGSDKTERVNLKNQSWLFELKDQYGMALDFTTERLRLHVNYFEADAELTFEYANSRSQWAYAGLDGSTPPQPQFVLTPGIDSFSPSKGVMVVSGVATKISDGSNAKYRNRAYGLSYELPFGFEVISEYQDDDQSITHYGALLWQYGKFTPYWIQSKSSSFATRSNAQYAKDERYTTSRTNTFGLRYDLTYNISLNMEYSYSEMLEKQPTDYSSVAPRGQFVVSNWTGTPVQPSPAGSPTTSPVTNWVQDASDNVHVWSAALNWNF